MNEYSSCYVQIQRTLKLKIRKKVQSMFVNIIHA